MINDLSYPTRAYIQHFDFTAPDFVNALEDEDHVYFFFREAAVEHINCGKVSLELTYNCKIALWQGP